MPKLMLARCIPIVFLLACGGGDATTQPPVLPPPPPPQPASVSVSSGDGQRANPGTPVATRPTVLVRDSASRPMAGVVVTFAVDSGGGSIGSTQATTAADGTASAGEWTLGPAEGPNVLRASVGSLAPVRIRAEGRLENFVLGTAAVGPGGGTVVVRRPGAPMDSLAVEVGDSTLATATTFEMRLASSAGMVPPDDASAASGRAAFGATGAVASSWLPISPVITVVTNGSATASQYFLVHVPLASRTGTDLLASVVDSARRPIAGLTIVNVTPTVVTVALRILDENVYLGRPVSPGAATRRVSFVVFGGSTTPVPLSHYYRRIFSHYLYVNNAFAFPDAATAYYPSNSPGMVFTEWAAAWFGSPRVARLGELAPGQPSSAARALMATAGYTPEVLRHVPPSQLRAVMAWARWPSWVRSQFGQVWQDMLADPTRPTAVPILLTDGRYVRFALVLGLDPNAESITIRDPARGPVPFTISLAGGVMTPYPDPVNPAIAYTTFFDVTPIARFEYNRAQQVLDDLDPARPEPYASVWPARSWNAWGTIQRSAPRPELHDTLFVLSDTTRLWSMQRQAKYTVGNTLPVASGYAFNPAVFYQQTPSGWVPQAPAGGSLFLDTRSVGGGGHASTWGIEQHQLEGPALTQRSWLGWRLVDVVRYALAINAGPMTRGTPLPFTATVTGSPTIPATAIYEWDFGDSSAVVRGANLATTTHTFGGGGPYHVQLVVRHPVSNAVMSRASTTVDDATAPTAWRITRVYNITAPHPLFDVLFTRPTDAVLFVFRTPASPSLGADYPTPGIYLQQSATPGGGASLVRFSPSGNATYYVAHTVTTPGTLVEGAFAWTGSSAQATITGKGTPMNMTCRQTLMTINATVSDTLMTGRLTLKLDEFVTPPLQWSWSFDAVRVR